MGSEAEYNDICNKLAETLLKDEMTAILVQLKVGRATRSTVTDCRKFIEVLQMREIVSIGNFHRLIPLLKDLELDEQSSLLERYMADYEAASKLQLKSGSIIPSKIDVGVEDTKFPVATEKEVPSIKTSSICKEHKTPQEVICLTCYMHVCFACAYLYHQDHQVVSPHEIEANIQHETKGVKSEIEIVEEQLRDLEDVIEFLEEHYLSITEGELQNILKESSDTMTSQEERFRDNVNYVARLSETDVENSRKVLSEVENEIFVTEEEVNAKLYPDCFTKLYNLNKRERKMKGNEMNINKIGQQLKDGSMQISARPASLSADIAKLSYGRILGAVMANQTQAVVIHNQGSLTKILNYACVSCTDSTNLFWEYTFECGQNPHPLVLGNKLHISRGKIDILVGFGNKVTIFEVDETKNFIFFVQKTSTHVDIPIDSYITAISTITGKLQDTGVIISDKTSGVLQILDNKFKLVKKIKHPGEFTMITCVFRENVYKYGVASSRSKSVDLLRVNPDDDIPREFGKLTVQNSNFHIQSLLFDGAFFTVLWVSDEETYSRGQRWKVVAYRNSGEECNVSKEGSCDPNVTAVTVSHVKNTSLVCFSNGTVELFQTIKT